QECLDGPVHGFDIEVEGEVPVFFRTLHDGAVVHEARRIQEDVDPADALGKGVDLGRAADIEPCRFGDAFPAQACDAHFIDVGGDHARAFARECHGAGAADAGSCCGHDGTLALQAV